jgi:hypothetical protein
MAFLPTAAVLPAIPEDHLVKMYYHLFVPAVIQEETRVL